MPLASPAHRTRAWGARSDHTFTESGPPEAAEPGLRLDALRQVAHTASRAAAGGLTRALRRRVTVSAPEFAVAVVDQLPAVMGYGDRALVAATIQLLGDLSGSLLWVMTGGDAQALAGGLLARSAATVSVRDPAVQAVLLRAAHTVAAAYADVLGVLTGGIVFLSVPELSFGPLDAVLARPQVAADPRHPHQLTVCVGSRVSFDDEGPATAGHVVLLPHHPAFGRILRALNGR